MKENDCISRKQTIERLKLNFPISQGADNSRDRHRYMQAMADIQAIREMPLVAPQEPRWIQKHGCLCPNRTRQKVRNDMETYEITAEMNLKKIIDESREVAQALNEFADNLERIEKKYAEPQEGSDKE